MLSKSIIAASLLVALAPSTVLGAPVPEAVEVEAREPMIMPAVPRIPTINNIIRRPVGRAPRLYTTRELDLEEREPMIMPLTPFIRPTTLSNIRRRPIGGGLLKTREVEEKLSARRLAHHAHLGHSSVDMGLHPAIRTRDLSDQDLEARLIFKGIRPRTRPIGFMGITREFDDETLEARQPIFGIIKKIGKGLLGRDLEELDAREWEELEARQPIFGIIKKIGKGIFGRELHELDAREWEELEARQPIFGIIKKIGKGIFGRELHELDAREWDELEARQPIFGIIKKIGKGIFGRDLEGLDAREWEELEARQPIFGIIKKIGKGIFGRELEDLNARQWEEVLERAVEHHHHHHTRGLELDQLD